MSKGKLVIRPTIKSLIRVLNCFPENTKILSIVYNSDHELLLCDLEHDSFPEKAGETYAGSIMEKDENGNNVENGKLIINMNGYEIREK